MKRLFAIIFCLLSVSVSAQIPSGFVQVSFTVPAIAGWVYNAAWTNLSSSPQLPLLGGVSVFQTTINGGQIDLNGHSQTLMADTAQIIPSPSTWTFSFNCPAGQVGGFRVQVAITGGGGTEDVSSEVTAAVPSQGCQSGGGGGGSGSVNPAPQFSVFGQQGSGTRAVASAVPNITADASGNFLPNASIPKVSPMADIRANGAKIDGATDIGPALAASMAQCNVANGNSCTVLLPCTGPNGCYWANGTDGVSVANGTTLILQGNLNLQTTLSTPNVATNIIGSDGGNIGAQFAAPNQTASITVPSTLHGTLGTAVTVTPTSGNFGVTQAFTPSTMAGLYANTWITIAGPLTCNITSLTRVSNLVTATLPSSCHIPPGVPVIIAGVADSSFNGSHTVTGFGPFTMLSSDYVTNTMTWKQSGQVDATSTGGTVTGLNEDTVENVQLSSCTVSTCTATFYRNHAATDLWGVDGVALGGNLGTHTQLLKNIAISAPGTSLDAGGYTSQFNYVSTASIGQCSYKYYNFPASVMGTSYMRFDSDAFDSFCGPYSMHVWSQWNYGFASAGPVYITNSYLLRGVKLDHGGADAYISNSTCDQCYAAISFDPNFFWNGSNSSNNVLSLNNVTFNDNPDGFPTTGIYQLTPTGTTSPGTAYAQVSKVNGAIQKVTNDYFPASSAVKSDVPLPYSISKPRGVVGTYNDGKVIEGEVRGEGANFSPALIPYATVNVNTNPSSWTGACNVATGVVGPDGTANAGGLTQNFGNEEVFGSLGSLTPAVGDVIIFGAWVYSPTPGVAATAQGTGVNVIVDNNSSTHFSFNYVAAGGYQGVGGNDSGIVNDWWHPVAGIATVTSSDGTTNQSVRLGGGCDTVKTIDYFNPWMIYVPASANIPLAEVRRWRTQLMHAYVPPNAAAGTLAANPDLNAPWAAPLLNAADITADPNPAVCPANYNANATSAFNVTLPSAPSTGCLVNLTNKNTATATLQVQGGGSFTCISSGVPGSATTCRVPEGDKGYANWNGTSWTVFVVPSGGGAGSVPAVPGWLLWQGDGSAGAFSCTTGTCGIRGENWYSSVTISSGATAFQSDFNSAFFAGPLTIRSTGTCTIAGTLSASPNASASGNNGNSFGAGSGGGGGGGTAAGSAGSNSGNATTAGTAGAASGGTGGNAGAPDPRDYGFLLAGSGFSTTNINLPYGGAKGGNGGSSGATGGFGGGGIVLDCATINFTGTIDVSGANGGAAAANNTGAGGGGGGGFVIMRSPNLTNSGTITLSGGAGGSCGAFTGCGAGGTGRVGWSEVFTQ